MTVLPADVQEPTDTNLNTPTPSPCSPALSSYSPRSFRRLYSLMLTLISLTARTAAVSGALSG